MAAPLNELTADQVKFSAEHFDSCAPLELVVVRHPDGFPEGVMLFHEGEFVGRATDKHYSISASHRVDPATYIVQFRIDPIQESGQDTAPVAVSAFTWDESADDVVWAGQLPEHRMSDVPMTTAHFPEKLVATLGGALPQTATPMEFAIPAEEGDAPADDPVAHAAHAGITSPDGNTYCDIVEDFMRCWNSDFQWPVPAQGNEDLAATVIFVTPAKGVVPSLVMGDGYGAPSGPETVLQPGHARYFNNYLCAASESTMACWEASTGVSFVITGKDLTVF